MGLSVPGRNACDDEARHLGRILNFDGDLLICVDVARSEYACERPLPYHAPKLPRGAVKEELVSGTANPTAVARGASGSPSSGHSGQILSEDDPTQPLHRSFCRLRFA